MDTNEEIEEFNELLLEVWDKKAYKFGKYSDEINEKILTKYSPFYTRKEFKKYIPSEEKIYCGKKEKIKYLYLKEPEDISSNVLIVLLLISDFSRKPSEVRIKSMFFEDKPQREKITSIGFRFESPEIGGRDHRYYHVQPINRFRRTERPIGSEGDDNFYPSINVPDSYPTIPTTQHERASVLFTSYLVSVYGVRGLTDIKSENTNLNISELLEKAVGGLEKSEPKWYWRVDSENGSHYYETNLKDDDFVESMGVIYSDNQKMNVNRYVKVTPEEYYRIGEDMKRKIVSESDVRSRT